MIGAAVQQQTSVFDHARDQKLHTINGGNMISFLEAQPGEGGRVDSLSAFFINGGEAQRHTPAIDVYHYAQAELGIGVTDPALSDGVFHNSGSALNGLDERRGRVFYHPPA